MKNPAKEIAKQLLEIGAIRLRPESPFTWASGWKSPIYCDNRLSLSFPETRSYIKKCLQEAVLAEFPQAEAVAGVATAGIPQGALVADALSLPFVYVRDKAKGHGMENMIEGKISPGQKVVVVEDLVSTGGSSIKAALALRAAGFEVLGMLSVFTYGFDVADENFKKENIKHLSLSNYAALLETATENGYADAAKLASLQEWRKDPAVWTGGIVVS